jgi:hypothetical protein
LPTLRRDGAAGRHAMPSLRRIASNLRASSGHFEPECFCAFRPNPGGARHILVLAIAHDECFSCCAGRANETCRQIDGCQLGNAASQVAGGHWRVVFLSNRPPNSKAAGAPPRLAALPCPPYGPLSWAACVGCRTGGEGFKSSPRPCLPFCERGDAPVRSRGA